MRNSELRSVFSGLGYAGVGTVLSSGNVLFETSEASDAALEPAIERAMQEHLGAPCACFVRSRHRMERLVGAGVFDDLDDTGTRRCMVTFLKAGRPRGPELPYEHDGSVALALHDDALFSVVDTSRPPTILHWMEREYGRANTTRSWRTVRRVMASFERRPGPR
jgi:uncharacterized protein (DUF1697 family)